MTHSEWQEKFIIKRQGKDFVLYAGLLHKAHEEGLVSILTTLVQVPDEKNGKTAICTATATFQVGDRTCIYTGIGDAAPNNVAPAMQTCLIRFAETRAKARALRDATNIGVAAFEELGNDEEPTNTPQSAPKGRTSGREGVYGYSPEEVPPTTTVLHTRQERDIEAEFKARKLALGGGGIHDFPLIRKIMELPAESTLYAEDYRDCVDKADDDKWRTAIAAIHLHKQLRDEFRLRADKFNFTGKLPDLCRAILCKSGELVTADYQAAMQIADSAWTDAIKELSAQPLALVTVEEVPVVEKNHNLDAFTGSTPEKVGA